MLETGESSQPEPAKVLVDIPNQFLPMLNEIIKLVDPRYQSLVANVLHLVPKDILLSIINLELHSLKIIECIDTKDARVRYGSFTKLWPIPDCAKKGKWQEIMGPFRDQEDHDVCWAIVVSELIRAIRLIEKREQDSKVMYSPQDLIDFANPKEPRQVNDKGHYCYPWSITKGFQYVMENGIQMEEDRPFEGCRQHIPERTSSQFGFIKDFVRLETIKDALIHLEHRPIGTGLALFHPEYKNIGKKIYRGPVNRRSTFYGLHAISLVAVGEENEEKYVLGRSSHGKDFGENGYIKISLEVMLVYIPNPGEEIDNFVQKYFGKPNFLVRRFSYPRLLTKDEEEIQKKIHQDKMEI